MSTGTTETNASIEDIDFGAFGGDEGIEDAAPAESRAADGDAVKADDADDDLEAEAEADDEGDGEGDDDDDLLEGEQADDDPEIAIDDATKLKRSEIKEALEKRDLYSKYADETQIIFRERQALTKQTETIESFLPALKAEWQVALDMAAASIPPDPDLSLLGSDPQSFYLQKQFREQAIARYNDMRGRANQSLQSVEGNRSKMVTDLARERQTAEIEKLSKAVPALKDEKKADAYIGSLHSFMGKYGFTKQEVNDIVLTDHRYALVMRKAALYDSKVAGKKPIQSQSVANSPPRAIPAASRSMSSPQKNVDRRSLAKALQSSASRTDLMDKAASYFND